jgi:uncharacterized membrane protein YphA (DoxX/SURF4 family)
MPDLNRLNPELGGPSLWPYLRRMGRALSHRYLTLFSRVVVGGILIFAGASKLGHIDSLIEEINKYQILSSGVASAYGHALPYIEVIVGVAILFGLFLTLSSLVAWLLFMSFTIAKIAAIAKGLDIEICSCLGPSVPLVHTQSLALDFVLLLLTAQIAFRRGELLMLGPWLWRKVSDYRPWRLRGAGEAKAKPDEPGI